MSRVMRIFSGSVSASLALALCIVCSPARAEYNNPISGAPDAPAARATPAVLSADAPDAAVVRHSTRPDHRPPRGNRPRPGRPGRPDHRPQPGRPNDWNGHNRPGFDHNWQNNGHHNNWHNWNNGHRRPAPRYDDGQYRPNPRYDDGQYHPDRVTMTANTGPRGAGSARPALFQVSPSSFKDDFGRSFRARPKRPPDLRFFPRTGSRPFPVRPFFPARLGPRFQAPGRAARFTPFVRAAAPVFFRALSLACMKAPLRTRFAEIVFGKIPGGPATNPLPKDARDPCATRREQGNLCSAP